jgi:4-amino-4-deoxy-L-arabinose transferase-like glycosyltransferase
VVSWFLYLLWRADESGRLVTLLGAGVLFGVALLTKVTLVYLLGPLVIVMVRRRAGAGALRALRDAAVALGLAGCLLLPWLIFNVRHFHALTADDVARAIQNPAINPTHHQWVIGDIPSLAAKLFTPLLPEEWWAQGGRAAVTLATVLVDVALIGGVAMAVANFRRRILASRWLVILGLPVVFCVATLATVISDFRVFQARYAYATLPALALLAAAGLGSLRGGERLVLVVSTVLSAAMVGLWVLLGTLYL